MRELAAGTGAFPTNFVDTADGNRVFSFARQNGGVCAVVTTTPDGAGEFRILHVKAACPLPTG